MATIDLNIQVEMWSRSHSGIIGMAGHSKVCTNS